MALDDVLNADLDGMFGDELLGVDVLLGLARTRGFLHVGNALKQDEYGMAVQVRGIAVRIRKGTLANVATDATITVDGTNYIVRDISDDGGDGRLQTLTLVKA